MTPIIFAPTKLAPIYLNDLVRTTDFFRVFQHVQKDVLISELSPIRDRMRTTHLFFVDTFCRFAGHDVVCEGGMLEPRTVLYRFQLISHGSRTPPTHPNKIILALQSYAPTLIPIARVTPHLPTNQAQIHQELYGNIHVNEYIRKETLVCNTVASKHGSPKGTFWRKRHVHEALVGITNNGLECIRVHQVYK
jgi:hypothetical protein